MLDLLEGLLILLLIFLILLLHGLALVPVLLQDGLGFQQQLAEGIDVGGPQL
jgi:hypothetical protein